METPGTKRARAPHPLTDPTTPSPAWLVSQSGSSAGSRFLIRDAVTRIGRDSSNDIMIQGEGSSIVSVRHLELRWENGGYRVCDLQSTNGTYLNGEKVTEAPLASGASIRLGKAGPEIRFETGAQPAHDLERTIALSPRFEDKTPTAQRNERKAAAAAAHHEELVSQAVREARQARSQGLSDQTHIIMREMLGSAVRRSRKNLKAVIGALAVTLVVIIALGTLKIQSLQQEKSDIDQQIFGIEAMLQEGGQNPEEIERLIARIEEYQARARELQDSVLYQLSSGGRQDAFIQAEIKTLMKDFGAETYSIPPEFTEQVQRFIEQFQQRDRRNVERALGRSRADLEVMRTVFQERNLPPDLAYIVLVESAFHPQSVSSAGAAGHWQFTAETARAYGMRVDEKVDERLDLRKSTQAASRYLRDLILEFGAGTSVMLALAAYNRGPTAVRRAIRRVEDPIKQRNFWYLYRARALPVETRQYVPKIIAAIIIGRNPERFGF